LEARHASQALGHDGITDPNLPRHSRVLSAGIHKSVSIIR